MAILITDDSQPRVVSQNYKWWQIGLVGAGIGVIYWGLMSAIQALFIEPVFCGSSFDARLCLNASATAGDITNVIMIIVGVIVLLRLGVLRPLVVAAASAVVLWGFGGWSEGLYWAEIAGWSALLFCLSYLTFSWIGRYTHSLAVLIVTVVATLLIRLALVV